MAVNNILLVSYIFPPSGGVGVQRALAYARHLPEHGARVFVVAARGGSCPVFDPGLLEKIPSGTVIDRTFTPEIPYSARDRIWRMMAGGRKRPGDDGSAAPAPHASRLSTIAERVFSPDPQVVWRPFALRAALRIVRKHDIGTVIVTAPPFSALWVGVQLKRRFPYLRLISEFRDEWVGYYIVDLHTVSEHRRKTAEKQERDTVEASDFVVAVTPAQTASIRNRYPNQPASKFLSIPNGYEPEMFEAPAEPRQDHGDTIVVSHLGTVYNYPVASPALYLEAVASLPEGIRRRIETVFIGRVSRDAAPVLDNAKCRIRQLGFMPQQEALKALLQTDFCLLISGSPTSHSGKTFEYLATGKPILALTPADSEAARLIRETKSGVAIDARDLAGVREALLTTFERFQQGGHTPDWEAIRSYERSRLVARLVDAAGLRSAGR
jgi:glycosyltransferase involved in cell wall biosynthesis